MKWLILMILVLSSNGAYPAAFKYEAYLGAVKIGQARVRVEYQDDVYEVSGSARAEGVVDVFGSWYARFNALGSIVAGVAELSEYSYVERSDDRRREITVRDDELRVIKNGKERPVRPALPGVDVLTALFVESSCDEVRSLHTGRHFYILKRQDQDIDVCRYHVTDDDGDSYLADIVYGVRDKLTIPLSITLSGFLNGRMVLVDP